MHPTDLTILANTHEDSRKGHKVCSSGSQGNDRQRDHMQWKLGNEAGILERRKSGRRRRKSVSGFVATIAGGSVTYSSKKKGSVALSSMESEYMALLHALRELMWLHRFRKEISYNVNDQNTIYCDNQSAIALAHNPEHHARTKHIDIQYHFVRNCVEDGTIWLEYRPTEDMVADGLTKALGPERHRKLAEMMGMGTWLKEGSNIAEV